VLSSPLIDKATIAVTGGNKLVIEARRSSPDAIYIQSVTINGKPSDKLWVRHEEIAQGGHIIFELGPAPNTSLATDPKYAPPSLTA
jgi:putative alpha-1,2-mannosidase